MADDDGAHAETGLAAQLMREAVLRELERAPENGGDEARPPAATNLELIARRLVDKAAQGDMAAIKEINERIDGKSLPGVAASGERETLSVRWIDHPSMYNISRDGSSGPSTAGGSASPAS
jgi:hypothetical protein